MLSRFVSKSLHLRLLTSISSQSQFHLQSNPNKIPQSSHPSPFRPIPNPSLGYFKFIPRHFSTDRSNNNNDNGSGVWNFSSETEDSLFGEETGNLEGTGIESESSFSLSESDSSKGNDEGADMFKRIDKTRIENEPTWVSELESKGNDNGDNIFSKALGGIGKTDHWATADGYEEDWGMAGEDRKPEVLYTFGGDSVELKSERSEDDKQLEREEKELSSVLQGPNRAFGDLVAVSGITEAMLDSLMALKDFEGVDGLPPLSMIEDMRYEKNTRKSTRAEIERQKQEEVAKARVRQVDSNGRAYGTGKRKCSIARVWIQPGEGKFVVNDKQFDIYFSMLDQRAALLRPFSETKTLGLWDVSCTVKGGGVSGQVGAVRLGISRALQNWEPALRPPLREAGFLTRDSRVVERKKPGKAKARKSFQWVKR